MSLSYFGQVPATQDKVAALQLLGRLVSPTCRCPERLQGIHYNECDGPKYGVAPLLPGQPPPPQAVRVVGIDQERGTRNVEIVDAEEPP